MPRIAQSADQPCSLARAARVLADPWTLLLLRNAFLGVTRFDDFQALSGAAKTVTADRLARMVADGLLTRRRYAERPPRDEYVLTEAGRASFPVLMALMAYGDRFLAADGPPLLLRHRACGAVTAPGERCTGCGAPLKPRAVWPEPGPDGHGPEFERMALIVSRARGRRRQASA